MMEKYKILFISPGLIPERAMGRFKDVVNVYPTLGVGYIAAVLEKNDFEVNMLDCIGQPMSIGEIISRVSSLKPNIIGITATILTINTAYEIASELKKNFSSIPLVIGGPHFSSDPIETMKKDIFDIGVMGEGEETFLEIVQAFRNNNFSLTDIKGIVYKKDGKILQNTIRPYISNLDTLPFPARHLYSPLSAYRLLPTSYRKKPVGFILTSRGCPYQCTFCDKAVFGNRFRAHSPKYVVDEIELLISEFGAREIKFADDIFTLDMNRVYRICEEIVRRKIKVPWTCGTRTNKVSLDLLKAMKRAGCWQVTYGLESGDDKMLSKMKKKATVDDNEKGIKLAKQAGLNVKGSFVFGMPGETSESIRKTIDFAKRAKLNIAFFNTLVLYPGNEIYKIANREGKILHSDYSQYTTASNAAETRLHYIPEGMTEKELKDAIVRAYCDYYFRLSFISRQILNIHNFDDIKGYWKGIKVLVSLKKERSRI